MAPFVSVPEARFLLDVQKTWMTLFKNDAAFSGLHLRTKHPDNDVDFVYPLLVLKRVGDEKWSLNRLSGHFSEKFVPAGEDVDEEPSEVRYLKGYTYTAMYQFDLFTRTINDQLHWKSLIDQKLLHGSVGGNAFASVSPGLIAIPLRDFDSPQEPTGDVTDLRINYRPDADVSGQVLDAFDPDLHQYAISVNFWVNYLKENVEPAIAEIVSDVTLEDETE